MDGARGMRALELSPCADEPPVAASGASATSLWLPAASGSLAISSLGGVGVDEGVVVLMVSALSCDGADEPRGVPAAPVVGTPAALT